MNILNKTRQGNVSVVVKQQDKENKSTNIMSFSETNENSIFKPNYFFGLCSNCENNLQCAWQRENKIFCEHYQ